jgi:long-chain acyl-CoA synthetase
MQGTIVSGTRQLSRADLLERASRAASGFAALGIVENDAIALLLRNDLAFFEAAFGAAHLGAYAVPVNWHFTAEEAGYILRDCAARALVVHADLLPQVMPAIPDGVVVLVVPTPPEIGAAYGIGCIALRRPHLVAAGLVGLERLDRGPSSLDGSAKT